MSDDKDFLEKKQLYCENHCKFKIIPTLIVRDENTPKVVVEQTVTATILCEYCGLVDSLELTEMPQEVKNALQEP